MQTSPSPWTCDWQTRDLVKKADPTLDRRKLGAYSAEPGRYDELLTREGDLREHWQPLITRLLG